MHGRQLSIALFSDSALPILNGVSVSIDLLVRELRSRGCSVHVFTTSYPGHKDEDPNTHRFRSIRTPWTGEYPLAVPPFYPLLREFRKQEFDLIHTHTPFTVGFVGLRWAESHEIPIVTTYHTNYDKYSYYMPFTPKRYLRYKIAKHLNFYYNSVQHVMTPSEASRRWLLRHSVRTPITVIPTGVPAPKMIDRSEARSALGLLPEQRVVLYAGRIAKEKNIGVLLSAMQAAFKRHPDLFLMVVGDGPAREEYSLLARRLGIGDRVKFVGFVPRAEVDAYYVAADLFAFSSMTETQGLVVVEAMSYGLPALVVQGGGAGEAVRDGENGYLLRNDPAEFAQHVLNVLSDDVLYTKLSDGAKRIGREYTVPRMSDRVLAVYRQALGARAGEPSVV
ncbi:MAG: glycosyltransferase family 4 protein [Armatimonadetes bacterium]|nr:glycosyltransferase family 4 protein [Armatimonadota bacterium]